MTSRPSSPDSAPPTTSSRLPRVLEPEGMELPDEVEAYDAMAHGGVNARFVADFLAIRPSPALDRVVDLGTGTALIPIALAEAAPASHVVAVDVSSPMLDVARRHLVRRGLTDRVELVHGDAKRAPLADGSASALISNSLVHHLPDPLPFFEDAKRLLAPGAALFVRDLVRPHDDEAVAALVALHAAADNETQRALFEASLRAALTLDEVRALVEEAGLTGAQVATSSDRHWTLMYRAPELDEGAPR